MAKQEKRKTRAMKIAESQQKDRLESLERAKQAAEKTKPWYPIKASCMQEAITYVKEFLLNNGDVLESESEDLTELKTKLELKEEFDTFPAKVLRIAKQEIERDNMSDDPRVQEAMGYHQPEDSPSLDNSFHEIERSA